MSLKQTVLDPEKERLMDEQIDKALEKASIKEFEDPEGVSVGLETEFPLVHTDGTPVDREIRNEIIEESDADPEVGATVAEIAMPPVRNMNDLGQLETALREQQNQLETAANNRNVKVLRYGTNPFVDLENVVRTDEEKYELVPETYDRLRSSDVQESFGKVESVDPRNADFPALICSTQLNLQVDGVENGLEMMNAGYMASPFIAAVSANSRFIDGKDLGFDDTRMQLWEKSHDDRESFNETIGVGKLGSYVEDLEDYGERLKDRPHILNEEKHQEAALDVGQGMFWKDARLKLAENDELKDEALAEFRIPSTQPSVEEEVAVNAFYLGRTLFAEQTDEDLMDIQKVNRNRYSAMYNGLDSKLYDSDGELVDSDEAVRKELLKAEEGLRNAGIDDPGYMDILYDRVDERMTPSDHLKQSYDGNIDQGMEDQEALFEAIKSRGDVSV